MSETEGAATFRTSADAYDRHVGRYGAALAAAMIETAGIAPPLRVLDVGCGPGALTRKLAKRLGPQAVTAIDPSESYAAAASARLPEADIHVGRAEALPFADASFDAALSQLVVNFMTDAPRGVAEMCRVTRPGGSVVSCVWDYAGEMTLLRTFWDAAVALDPNGAGPRDEGRCMRYCSPAELEALWHDAGLEQVRTAGLVVTAGYESFDDLWAPLAEGVAPSGAYAASLSADARDALRVELRRRLGSPDVPFRLSARAWCAVGRVPSLL